MRATTVVIRTETMTKDSGVTRRIHFTQPGITATCPHAVRHCIVAGKLFKVKLELVTDSGIAHS